MQVAGVYIRPLVELFAFAIASWVLGVCAYVIGVLILSARVRADEVAVAGLWSAVVFFPLLPTVYLPVAWGVRALWRRERVWPLAISGVALAPIPVTVMEALWGRLRVPAVSTENLLFLVLFAVAGAIFSASAVE